MNWAEVFSEPKETEEYGRNKGVGEGDGCFAWQSP